MPDFDLIVIGAGPAGYVSAIKAAQLGLKTAVVEGREVGGTCLNRGCIPTKTFVHTASLMHEIKNCVSFGVEVEGARFNLDALYNRKNEIVSKLRSGIEGLFRANKIELICGKAKVAGEGRVLVGDKEYSCKNILIATGSVPSVPPIPGINLPNIVNSDDLLGEKPVFYKSIIILGGGVIGMEFANIYNSLGCEVTVIEAQSRILPNLDKEISQNLTMILKKRGVKIICGAMVESFEQNGGIITANYTKAGKNEQLSAEGVLVSVGRRANAEGLLADGLDLKLQRGQIPVNSDFETCIKGVYAVGDVVAGSPLLAHTASAQGINAVSKICGKSDLINLDIVPYCIYTNPEIAEVGINAEAAKQAGIPVKTGKYIMSQNAKSMISNADRGFIKVVIDERSEKIIGAQMMCERATDMVTQFSTAIANGLTASELSKVIYPHPTFSEGILEAVESTFGISIHSMPISKR